MTQSLAFEHVCEVCGTRVVLTPDEAFNAGWDYPPQPGYAWQQIAPRTCGECGMADTLWAALTTGALDQSDPMGWPERHRRTLQRILTEPPSGAAEGEP